MNFANPIFFWTFLSLIPLVAIYLLKVRPTRKPTTAYFLWQEIFKEKRAQSLLHKLRDALSLLLMLLVFSAIALALAKPVWQGDDRKDLVLLIDNSASMSAEDGFGSRLTSAKKTAAQIVESLNGTQRCSIAAVSNKVRYVSNMTDNPRELLNSIDSISPSDLPFDPSLLDQFHTRSISLAPVARAGEEGSRVRGDQENETTEQAKTLNENSDNENDSDSSDSHRIILIGDGLTGAEIPPEIELLKIGDQRSDNAGIIACDLQRLPGNNRVAIFYQLASSFTEPIEAELVLSYEDRENAVKLIPVTIDPGTNRAAVFELEDSKEGRWQLTLEIDDALPNDNHAFLVLPPVEPIPVRVDTKERFFFENSVLAFSNSGGILKLVDEGGQLRICQGTAASSESPDTERAPADLLIFRPEGESPWWSEAGEEIEVAIPRVVDDSHPAMRHMDAASIPFVGARRLTVPPGAEVWVVAEDGTPLIYKLTRSGSSAVVVNLDPLNSNFYFSAWFPVLVYSTAKHLAGRTETLRSTYATGQVSPVLGSDQNAATEITLPDGETVSFTAAQTPPMQAAGFYQLKRGDDSWLASSSLLSANETLINNGEIKDSSKPINRGWSPVGLLTVLAIVFITLESILYQRRKVG